VCIHPDRDRIDGALTAPGAVMAHVARRFEIDDSTMHRHAQNHLPARLLRQGEALAQASDAAMVKFAIAESVNRMRRIQKRADALAQVVEDRAAAADATIPGDRTGLLVKRPRSYRIGKDVYKEVIDVEVDAALLAEERALERAAVLETGEWLAQTGKGQWGTGAGGNGPLVVVLASGLQPLPGERPGEARHRITDARRKVTRTAAEQETVAQTAALALTDIELPGEDTRQGALAGTTQASQDASPDVAYDDDVDET